MGYRDPVRTKHNRGIPRIPIVVSIEPKEPRDGSGKFKATPEKGRSDTKSKVTPIQQLDDKNPAVKSRVGSKRKTSKVATSSNEKTEGAYGGDGTKVNVSPQTNNSNEPPEDKTPSNVKSDGKSNGANDLPSVSTGKSVKRSRRRLSKGEKNPQTVTESAETKAATSRDAAVVKNDVLTPAKSEGKSDGKPEEHFRRRARRKSGKPIVETSSIGTQTDIEPFNEYNTPSTAQDKHEGADALKLSSRSSKTIKMKEIPTAATDGIIDVKNSASGGTKVDDSLSAFGAAGSQRSAGKPNKRRRK